MGESPKPGDTKTGETGYAHPFGLSVAQLDWALAKIRGDILLSMRPSICFFGNKLFTFQNRRRPI